MKFTYKRWLLVANNITSMLLRRERAKEDKRVEQLQWLLVGATVLLLLSVGVNIYIIMWLTGF